MIPTNRKRACIDRFMGISAGHLRAYHAPGVLAVKGPVDRDERASGIWRLYPGGAPRSAGRYLANRQAGPWIRVVPECWEAL